MNGLVGVRSVESVNGHISLLTDLGVRMGIAVAVKSMGELYPDSRKREGFAAGVPEANRGICISYTNYTEL